MIPIDLNYQGVPDAASVFLLKSDDGPVLVESGPMSTLDTLKASLHRLGVAPESIQHIFLTHIHLDHAGAAGWFANQGATIHVHPRGAVHLIDPTRLNDSAARVYGDRLIPLLGTMHAVPEPQVNIVADRETIDLPGLSLRAIHTPGHASHHYAWAMEHNGEHVCFTGDIAGMRIPSTDCVTLPMAPPEFDHAMWHASIDRLDAAGFDRLILTHSNVVDDPTAHFSRLRARLDDEVAKLRTLFDITSIDDDERTARFLKHVLRHAASVGVPAHLASKHLTLGHAAMNVMGIRRMLRREAPS